MEILALVYDYRFMASDQVTRIIAGSERKILARLQKLFHHGYLERLCDRRIRTRAGSDKMVYTITQKAAEFLIAEMGLPITKLNWTSKNRTVTERHIKHTLMIGKFRTALTLAVGDQERVGLAFWRESRGIGQNIDPELSDKVTVGVGDRGKEQARIIPDAFLAVETAKSKHFLYLEADRSTMTNERFLKKLKAYWIWWKQGGSRKKHGVDHFRVLTVTRSYERRDNLKRIALEASPGTGGSGMFWFACEKDYEVSAPESILRDIWVTAKSKERHSLLE
ncbi:MAG: replication-relaxation family protein [Syntrophobacteraceae bacterium]